MMSIKTVNALSHYTDWTVAHVHSGALGWNGFMVFGMVYWLIPRLWKTKLYSLKLANAHFWFGTIGILLYIIAMYTAGVTQGLMWRAFDETGRLMYPDFIETAVRLVPMYWVRLIGGSLYLLGILIGGFNLIMSIRSAPRELPDTEVMVPELARPTDKLELVTYDETLGWFERAGRRGWHRALEGWPMVFTLLTLGGILIGSVIEIIPVMLVRSNVPTIATVTPYTPLEFEGRDIYIREGCVQCHSQMVRPFRDEIERYGEYSKAGEHVYEHPFLWGSKRTGPDLARVGGKYPHLWHVRHMEDPREISGKSPMPPYPWLLEKPLDLSQTQQKIEAMMMLGVPYTPAEAEASVAHAKAQAQAISDEIVAQGGPAGLADKEIVALVAYLQRLGQDIKKTPAPERK